MLYGGRFKAGGPLNCIPASPPAVRERRLGPSSKGALRPRKHSLGTTKCCRPVDNGLAAGHHDLKIMMAMVNTQYRF